MRRASRVSTHTYARGGVTGRVWWIALALLIVILPVLDLAWGEVAHHGQPCPLHASLIVPQAGATLVASPPSSPLVPLDSAESVPSFAASIFIPPRP